VFGTSLLAHFLFGHFSFCPIYNFWSPLLVSSNCSYCCDNTTILWWSWGWFYGYLCC